MAYRTLAWVMAFICGLAIPAGAAALADGVFDQPIFQPDACRGVITRNMTVNADVLENGILAATTAHSQAGGIIVVDNARLVWVHGNAVVGNGMANEKTYNKTTVASLNNSFNQFTGVANVNVAAGNLNIQSNYFSGPDLSSNGLLATGGSAKLAAMHK